jgi:RpiR family carbohydrate utilization transcriptional regulator
MPGSRPNARPVAGTLLPRLRGGMPALTPSEAKVARYVLGAPHDVVFQSVSEVGQSAGTAASTVVRCAHRLGFAGFQDLKIALAQELGSGPARSRPERGATRPAAEVLAQVTDVLADAVRGAASTVDPLRFAAVAAALSTARRVLLAGVGPSAPLVQDAAFRFLAIGVQAEAPAGIYAQQLSAHLVGTGDVFLAVSHSGSGRETVAAARQARRAGALTAALTSVAWSPLAEAVEYPLVAGACAADQELEALAGRLAHIAVLDALLVAVSRARPGRTARHREHYRAIRAEHRP